MAERCSMSLGAGDDLHVVLVKNKGSIGLTILNLYEMKLFSGTLWAVARW
jgi:hypothetical protein